MPLNVPRVKGIVLVLLYHIKTGILRARYSVAETPRDNVRSFIAIRFPHNLPVKDSNCVSMHAGPRGASGAAHLVREN